MSIRIFSAEDFSDFMASIEMVLKNENIHHKWVNGLTLYPDEYHKTAEDSWYMRAFYLSDEMYYENIKSSFTIDFEIDGVESIDDFKEFVKKIKLNKKEEIQKLAYDFSDLSNDFIEREKRKEAESLTNKNRENNIKELNDNDMVKTIDSLESIKSLMEKYEFKTFEELDNYFKKENHKRIYSKSQLTSDESDALLKDFLINDLGYDEEHVELKIASLSPYNNTELFNRLYEGVNEYRNKSETNPNTGVKDSIHTSFKDSNIFKELFDKKKKEKSQTNTM